MRITLGKSLAGHDKNHIYVVYRVEDGYAYLVNGVTKQVDSPKKKKLMHIQLIKKLPAVIEDMTRDITSIDDDLAEELVRAYNNYLSDVTGEVR